MGRLRLDLGFFMRVARMGSSISRDSLKSRLGNMVIMGRDAFINARASCALRPNHSGICERLDSSWRGWAISLDSE